MGKAKARVEASRDTLYRAAEAAYAEVVSSHALLSVDANIRLQLAVCFAAEACAEAVRFVSDVTGASSIRVEHPFERHFRDAHVLLQHSSKSSPRYGSAGRLLFGLDNDWVWLSFLEKPRSRANEPRSTCLCEVQHGILGHRRVW